MVILNIVHWSFSGVLLPLLFDAVNGDGFLQDCISAISLVGEHIHDHALAKADGFAGDIIALSLHHLGNIVHGFSSQIEIEYTFHDGRFTRYDLRLTVSTLFIAKEPLIYEHWCSFLELLANAPSNVLTDAFGFGLCEASIDDQIQLAVCLECVNLLLLKVDADAFGLEHSDIVEAVYRISRKAGYGFGDDVIDLPGQTVVDHFIELGTLVGSCAGLTLVSEQACEAPVFTTGDHLGVHLLLVGIGDELFFAICRDSAVCRHSLLPVFFFIYRHGAFWLYDSDDFLRDFRYFHRPA